MAVRVFVPLFFTGAATGMGVEPAAASLPFVLPFRLSELRLRGRASAAGPEPDDVAAAMLAFFTGILQVYSNPHYGQIEKKKYISIQKDQEIGGPSTILAAGEKKKAAVRERRKKSGTDLHVEHTEYVQENKQTNKMMFYVRGLLCTESKCSKTKHREAKQIRCCGKLRYRI